MCKVLLNNELNGVELYFNGKPSQEVREEMKNNGFRWNGKKVCWYAKQNNKTIALADKLGNENLEVTAVTKKVKELKEMNLFELTTYTEVERELIYDNKEIAKQIRTHVKKRFPFVKFSITTKGYNSINCDIVASPFEEGSKYLKAIQEYCVKFANSFNYNNSDIMTDYFDVNFYGGYFQTSWKYEQTEVTEEVKEMMRGFDKEELKAFEAKKAEEERQYQEYLKDQEEANKKYELRLAEEKKQEEYINNNVEVVEVEEDKQYFVKNAKFANCNKNNTLDQYKKYVHEGDYYLDTLKVTREIHLKDYKALNYFNNMLLHDFDFIEGTGGSYTEDLRINSMSDYHNMIEEERKSVQWILHGIAVYCKGELIFVIDAQGFGYARYVGLIDNTITTVEKEIEYKQVVTVEEVEELKVEANEVIKVFNEVIENNSLDDWYNTRRKFVKAVKEKDLWLHGSVVQQVQDEKIKLYMYRTLKENDNIKDQFNDGKFIIGEKLTIIRESMIGGASITHITFNSLEELETGVKMVMSVNGKRGLFETKLNDKDNIIIYKGHLVIPENVLYEDTSNEYFNGIATRYGSYDKAALRAITSHLREKNILPVINTFEPIF